MPISTRRATTLSICSSVARSCITTTIVPAASAVAALMLFRAACRRAAPGVPVHQTALEPSCFVNDAFDQPRACLPPQRPFRRDASYVGQHLLLALGLVDFDTQLLLQRADLAGDTRAFIQQAHEDLVHAIDVVAKLV